uniref:NADPH-dependent diflavin oxidoreductase 1 n=1 Tax=Meloidogyne hapla TaxID=6305 RepID=A0A1I8C107_MELHA
MPKIKILYGSETGTAQDFAEHIWQNLHSRNVLSQCLSMDDYFIELLPKEELIIFIVSTSGNGDVPTNMRKSWTFLLSKRLSEGKYLDKLKFSLLGLGDSSYTKYNFAAKKLFRRLIQLGAKPLTDLALADDQDTFGVDEVFEKWFFELLEENKEYFAQPSTSTIPRFYFDILLEDDNAKYSNNYYPLTIIKNERVTNEEHFQETRLISFCIGDDDDYYEYCIYSKRSIAEFLRDFPQTSSLLTIKDFLDFFPIIRPRAFSIASSPDAHPEEIQILVTRVEYNIRRIKSARFGLCSNFLCSIKPGHQVYARISPGIFKYDKEVITPYILIGPGTGIAPFRSLIVENELNSKSPITLFFGCRNEKMDFYFKDEWSTYKNLKLFTAFSRDQERKIYVQHRISENSKEMWNLINSGAKIFIAGSAGDMPKQVISVFKQIFIGEGNMSSDEADKFIEIMEKKKLIQYETWS